MHSLTPSMPLWQVFSQRSRRPRSSMDHPKTPQWRRIIDEHEMLIRSLIALITKGLQGEGRGIINTIKPGSSRYPEGGHHYSNTAQKLVYLAVQNNILDAASIIADIGALQSQLRGPFIALFEDADDQDPSKFGVVVASQELQRLRTIITKCCNGSGAVATARSEVQRVEYIIAKKTKEKKQSSYAMMTFKGLAQAGQFVNEHGEPAILPAALLMKDAPKLSERLTVHAAVLKAMVLKLRKMEKEDTPLIMSRETDFARGIVFKCMFLMSSAMLPQRKSPWQRAIFGKPQSPWTQQLKLDVEFLEKTPVYVYYRDDLKQWGLTQLRTKDSARPWMAFPPEMNELISLYLGRLHAGYTTAGIPVQGSPVFPNGFNRVYGDSGFKIFEAEGFKELKLQGASVFNARHAVTLHCLDLDITPTSNNSSLADSIAKGMGTDTKHMFGEHKMLRTWGKKGAYSAAGEADGARRAEAGICEYWTWVFGKKQNKRKRV